ncbi:DUF805 domain-containing protein [Endozoicomonadaceae bacterium StTr2]
MEWYLKALKQYADFKGRARRKEYWMFFLINFVITLVLSFLDGGEPGISTVYALLIMIPGIAVTVRRLHDTERTGWWVLIGLIPVIGTIVLLIFCTLDSDAESNNYGPNPKLAAV